MKVVQRISVLGLAAFLSQSVFAVQGNLQSSSGFVASTVGGATVAQFTNEFDAVIDNPALMQMTKTKPGTHKFSLGFEYADYTNWFDATGTTWTKGKLNTAYIPFASYFYNINERVKFGTGIYGIGGTGFDYSNSIYLTKGTYAAISIPLAVSYKVTDDFNIGASLNIVLTSLTNNNFKQKNTSASAGTVAPSLGATYSFMKTWLVGADLTLGTTASFKNLYYVSSTQSNNVKIGTPLQFSLGIGDNSEHYSYGFKYRYINWKNTENYKQLDWVDQHTLSLGGQYCLSPEFVGRAGVYYVTSVYNKTSGVNGDETITYQGQSLSKKNRDFTNAMQYGIPQWQYAIGLGYKMTAKSIFDFGFVYEPNTSIKFTGTSAGAPYEWRKKNYNLQVFVTYSQEV